MECVNCGAPLPANSMVCRYCQTLNDVDLRTIEVSAGAGTAADQDCPRCRVPLRSIRLGVGGGVRIERCARCLGLFFNPGELERVLSDSSSDVFDVDGHRLRTIAEDACPQEARQVRYVCCPVCGDLMNRRNYGAASGVVIDACRRHGLWLDGGELGHILKWARAGGRIYDAEKKAQRLASEARDNRVAQRTSEVLRDGFSGYSGAGIRTEGPLLDLIMSCLSIFRGR
ncbi:MAG: zf-TFIIB domain-containing protein [Phycisphaerae bacterium]